ncbi:MAG: glycoside hydrolase family 3 C-terminal domain-containing protein [Alphaproteobacteria bacterium]|nr:glycoside hydrolase family 3 C-terminal domain-containing protein [Alphaproteobacteria bacterium]
MPHVVVRTCVAALLVAACVAPPMRAQAPVSSVPPVNAPWMNQDLSPDQRADLVQAQMTPDEEFTLVRGYLGLDEIQNPIFPRPPKVIIDAFPHSAGYIPGIPRLGIPAQLETDASLGVANGRHMRPGDQATALPASLLTASAWNPDLAYDAGAMLGREVRAKGFNVLLNGGVDLERDPRNGRNFEYAGEDPLLAGTIAGEVIRGVQDQHVISTAKHYAMNDQEIGRDWLSANIDEKSMRESDLLAFEIAIERGRPGSIMCAYNRVNGVYACENDFLLNKVLKGDWQFPGYVMSDWGADHSTVEAANNGLDQESAYIFDNADYFGAGLRKAVADGKVSEARLHDMVHRILRSMFAHGLFDYPLSRKPLDVKADGDVAQRAAEEGITLLKNDRELLPLTGKARRIAVIGANADIGVLSGGGSSQVIPIGNDPSQEVLLGGAVVVREGKARIPLDRMIYDPPSPLSAIKAESRNARVRFDDGGDIQQAARLAKASDVAVVFVQQWQAEGTDMLGLNLPGDQDALVSAVAAANPHTIVVLENGGPVVMPWLSQVGAVLEAWYPGQRGAAAIARILFGKVNPSGHLAATFPQSVDQLPRPVIPGAGLEQPPQRWAGTPNLFDVNYTEGANVGYKWFAVRKLRPLFPFGFGLSYTTFGYGNLSASPGSAPTVTFDVRNTGQRAGKAVAQVYATPPGAVARLMGWSKIDLKPGASKHVTVTLDPRLLASFDTAAHVWRVAAGDYTISLGDSATSISSTTMLHLDESTIRP